MNFQEQVAIRREKSDRLRPRVLKAIETLTLREGSLDLTIGERLFVNKAVVIAPRFPMAWKDSEKVDRHKVGRSLQHFLRGTKNKRTGVRTFNSKVPILQVWEATCYEVEEEAKGNKPQRREQTVVNGQLQLSPLFTQLEDAILEKNWDTVAAVRDELQLREL